MRLKRFTILFILLFSKIAFTATISELHPQDHEGYEVKEDKIFFRYGNSGLIVEAGNDQSIGKYYSDRGVQLGNPFQSIGGDMQGASVFILTLINRSKASITFTPSYVALKIKDEAFFPMDFTTLLGFLDGLEPALQKVLQKSIFHSPETVRPGEVVTKLLIYPALPKKFTELKLDFDYLYFENHEIKTAFYFARKKD